MRVLVTGGAGFIGSSLVRGLLERGDHVIVLDNLSSGKMESIRPVLNSKRVEFHHADLLGGGIQRHMRGVDEIWHLAANSDVRVGNEKPWIHLEQNFIATINVLDAMKESGMRRLIFASSSAVYGEAARLPTPEGYAPLKPISLYGASKLLCEAAISIQCQLFGLEAVVFRLANVVGRGSPGGVIRDFIDKLQKNNRELHILGNGRQRKSYIHISDCINAMLIGSDESQREMEIFNIASEDNISVKRITEIVSEEMGLSPFCRFSGGLRGWRGDVPVMRLDISKIKKRGWRPLHNSEEAVHLAAREMIC